MADYENTINAYYGGDNDYFLLEDGNVLEVINDDMAWDHFKGLDEFRGIASSFNDLREQLNTDSDAYSIICNRAIDQYIKENEGKYNIENAGIPGASNIWNVYDKETGDCLFNDYVYTNDEDAHRDVMAAFFAQEVAQTSLSREVWGYVRDYGDLEELLDYCDNHGVDISDVVAYSVVESSVERDYEAIAFVTKEMADGAGGKMEQMLSAAVKELQSFLDGDIYRVAEYDRQGNEVDYCGGFIGDNIDENGIGDIWGIKDNLGQYANLEDCYRDHADELGIEVEDEKPLNERIHQKDER